MIHMGNHGLMDLKQIVMQPTSSNKYLILKRAMKQIGQKTSEFIQNDAVLV